MAIAALASALSALKAAKDIAESMIRGGNAVALQGKMLEFQSKIIDANNSAFEAQEERTALLERVSELEKQVTSLEAWETQKSRYELREVSPLGAFAYALKMSPPTGEPFHFICAHCYEARKKSIFQALMHLQIGRRMHQCPSCKVEIPIQHKDASNAVP